MNNLKKLYEEKIVPELMKQFQFKSVMQVPKIEKIVINSGIGDATADSKNVELAYNELMLITGQKPIKTRAKKSIATFKLKEGQEIGVKVTLRHDIMWNFLEKLITVAIPRIRDFRGLSPKCFDGRGNCTIGIKEQIIFPEIHYDDVKRIRGFDITFVISSDDNKVSYELLKQLGMPFVNLKETN